MKEVVADLWEYPADATVITTNGMVKKNGACVMGRGCAKEARDRYPGIDHLLGRWIKNNGNIPAVFYVPDPDYERVLVTLPVKHNWWQQADLDLIRASVLYMKSLVQEHDWKTIVMPRPGCGNGNLEWTQVREVLAPLLDDRFTVVSY